MTTSKKYKLGDITDIIMGQSPEGHTCNKSGNGTPLLNGPTEFGDKYPVAVQYTTDPKKYSEPGDILFCVRGSTTGRMNYSDKKYAIGRGLAAIRHKKGKELQPFVRGLIDIILPSMLQHVTGSTFPNLSKEQLNNYEVEIPDLPTQTRIASILSALDDKIELNRRTNHTLEQMAQTLFKKYFVTDIDPDNLPEGWRLGKLGDIYKTTSGGTPSRSKMEFYTEGNIAWVKSKELNGDFILDTEEKITEDAVRYSSAKKLPVHSVLVAMYGATVGEIATLSIPATCNQAICAILPNENYSYSYIFQFLKLNKEELINRASGSAQQNISQLVIQNFELIIPPVEVVKEFDKIASDFFKRVESNLKENKYLSQLRDTLLPKLMSGELTLN